MLIRIHATQQLIRHQTKDLNDDVEHLYGVIKAEGQQSFGHRCLKYNLRAFRCRRMA